jgi:hypothetical protein
MREVPKTKEDYVERLAPYRRRFLQIAAHKYKPSRYELEVFVLAVDITDADLR